MKDGYQYLLRIRGYAFGTLDITSSAKYRCDEFLTSTETPQLIQADFLTKQRLLFRVNR